MDRESLLVECKRLRDLIKNLKDNPTEEPYYSIQMEALTTALSKVGRELQKLDTYGRGR